MAEIDIAISLIQLIALFFPAWAVMVQIFSRVISADRISRRPRAIPFVAGAFAAAILSLFQFAYAAVQLLEFFRVGGFLGGSSELTSATVLIAFGGLTFLFLGVFVLAEVGMNTFEEDDFLHIIFVTIAFVFAAAIAWVGPHWETVPMSARPGRVAVAISLVWAADILYIQYTDPRVGMDEAETVE